MRPSCLVGQEWVVLRTRPETGTVHDSCRHRSRSQRPSLVSRGSGQRGEYLLTPSVPAKVGCPSSPVSASGRHVQGVGPDGTGTER